jgi:hypothetical protein
MSRQSDATRASGQRASRDLSILGAGLLALAACSQTAGVGAARSGTRLGAAQLEPRDGTSVVSAPGASGAPVLELLDRHETFAFNRGAAEIVDYHAPSRRVFVVDSGAARVRVLELGASGFRRGERALEPGLDIARSEDGDAHDFETRAVTSLAVAGDWVAVAVPASRNDRRGRVALYSAADLRFVRSATVGFGPDMLTFTPDGQRILVANEGEQVRSRDERIIADPEGSVSIIDLRGGVQRLQVSHARFDSFDARIEEYRAAGVRIGRLGDRFFESGDGEVRLSRDLEPEYVAVTPDGSSAWVTLQENDAVAKLDIGSASFVDIFPLGVKDFSRGQPRLARVSLAAPSVVAGSGQQVEAERVEARSNVAGLCFEPAESQDGREVMYVLRGSALERHRVAPDGVTSSLVGNADARLGGAERLRGLARDSQDGSFWLGDATRAVLYRLGGDGGLLDEVKLPGAERGGVAALAWDADRRHLIALLDAPAAARWARLLVIDADPGRPSFGEAITEHAYPSRAGAHPVAATWVEPGRLIVTERSDAGHTDVLYRVDLTGAGDVRALERGGLAADAAALEALLGSHALVPVHKRVSFGVSNPGADVGAGLAALPGGRVALLGGAGLELSSGRVGAASAPAPGAVLGVVSFDGQGGLDASDRDGTARLDRWPVLGAYMPDGIATLRAGGDDYFITANEGDTRGYDVERLRDLELDPSRFPNAAALQSSASLGRLKVSSLDGDLDGDGDLDEVHAFGARSLSVWDRAGRLVFDTGSLFEDVTATALAEAFNSNNDENGSFDSRSDDRGPEPEGLTVADIDGRTYAFVGLERVGGIVVLDITDPSQVRFVEYDNLRDFSGDVERGAARDLGPEGLKFVPAGSSPTGRGLLLVANEVSGTTTAYDVNL